MAVAALIQKYALETGMAVERVNLEYRVLDSSGNPRRDMVSVGIEVTI